MKMRRKTVLLLVVALLLFLVPKDCLAVDPPNTLKVYAQYFGMPETASLIGEYTRAELDALSYDSYYGYEGCYCNVTRVNTVLKIHARGIKLAEFLSDYNHIDLSCVRQIDFHTSDISQTERFVSKGRYELLDSMRYYYPHLMENSHIDYEKNARVIDNQFLAQSDAVVVPTIIACVQGATKASEDAEDLEMTVDSSFRLCVGQPDLTSKTSFESAKWVDAIYVVLAGSPEDGPQISDGKIGTESGQDVPKGDDIGEGSSEDDPKGEDEGSGTGENTPEGSEDGLETGEGSNTGDEGDSKKIEEPGMDNKTGSDDGESPKTVDEEGQTPQEYTEEKSSSEEQKTENEGSAKEINKDDQSEASKEGKTDDESGSKYSEISSLEYKNYISWKETSTEDLRSLEVTKTSKKSVIAACIYLAAALIIGMLLMIFKYRKEK